jgi:hypothetical protein
LYEKFQTVWDAVRYEDVESEEEYKFDTLEEEYRFENGQPFANKKIYKAVNESTTSVEEDEAFKDLEKAIRNWKPTAP